MDVTKALSELSLPPGNAETDRVLQIYERVMKIYEASIVQYQAAIKAGAVVNGFSTSTSGSSDVAIQ